jgi:hypothetical protein
MTEHWGVGNKESYLYTDDPELALTLKKDFPRYATYRRSWGGVYAWQFKIGTNLIPKYLKKGPLKNKELQEPNFQISTETGDLFEGVRLHTRGAIAGVSP